MKRTQLYLEDDLWQVLHMKAKQSGESMSELVRRAAREKYIGGSDTRALAMQSVVGLWRCREDLPETEGYVRSLRKGSRLTRLSR